MSVEEIKKEVNTDNLNDYLKEIKTMLIKKAIETNIYALCNIVKEENIEFEKSSLKEFNELIKNVYEDVSEKMNIDLKYKPFTSASYVGSTFCKKKEKTKRKSINNNFKSLNEMNMPIPNARICSDSIVELYNITREEDYDIYMADIPIEYRKKILNITIFYGEKDSFSTRKLYTVIGNTSRGSVELIVDNIPDKVLNMYNLVVV
ncbi:hypothetical protein BCR32DRAFT_114306 [Anaeromyces robustus]|uniref:Uncharacterized protein n=1 Tax=Anaeromyces robustus TaxID=1754192 RepID=A0A1Y1XH93_9FUNG|nr:hypothetical protein BCR32DRAFT_114306 [Anaeromyces robustus]|eukprot:ORX84754.1 hypothetical protein BCR32DRAFT_114306 [Anaeromyces robustus]